MSWSGFRRDAAGDGRGERLRAPRRGGRTGEKKEAREAGGRAVGRAPLSRGPRRARAIERPRAPEPRRDRGATSVASSRRSRALVSRRESPLRARSCADLGRRHRGRLEEPRWPFSRPRAAEEGINRRWRSAGPNLARARLEGSRTLERRSRGDQAPVWGGFTFTGGAPRRGGIRRSILGLFFGTRSTGRSLIGRFRARTLWWSVRAPRGFVRSKGRRKKE